MRRRGVSLLLYGFMLLIAAGVVSIGTLTPQMQAAYALPLGRVGLLGAVQSAGGILALLLGARCTDIINERLFSGALMAALCVACLILCLQPPLTLLLVALFLYGMCQQLLMVTVTLSLARENPGAPERAVTLGHTVYGVGSFFAPVACGFLAERFGWTSAFGALALLIAALTPPFLRLARPFEKRRAADEAAAPIPWRDRRLWLLCLMGICYMGHLGLMGTWLPMALAEAGLAATAVGRIVSAIWLGLSAGRLQNSAMAARVPARAALVAGGIAGAACLLAGALASHYACWIASCAALGLLTGAFLPLLLALPSQWYPDCAGSVTSLTLLSGSAGNLLMLWLGGLLAQGCGSVATMYAASALALLSALLALRTGKPLTQRTSSML